jgi:hypothetical protein
MAGVLLAFSTAGCEQKKTKVDELIASASEPASPADAGKRERDPLIEPVVAKTPRERPPRPLPQGKWGPVQMTDPLETQQKTLAYTYAMATPDPGDPPANKAFIEAFKKKVEQAARAMDPEGGDRVSVTSAQGDRRVEVELSSGCTERTPFNLAVQRASTPLGALAQAGVYVVQCHDAKWKCVQSTREPDDVICVVAPRR